MRLPKHLILKLPKIQITQKIIRNINIQNILI